MSLVRLHIALLVISITASTAFAQQAELAPNKSDRPERLRISSDARPVASVGRSTTSAVANSNKSAVETVSHSTDVTYDPSGTERFTHAANGEFSTVVGSHSNACGTVCPTLYAGVELTFLTPRFSDNLAYTLMQSDGINFRSFTPTEFNYDLSLSPRVIVGTQLDQEIGFRATWWHFDQSPETLSVQPPANGFGSITHPPFENVDISTTIPGETFQASTSLKAYTLDFELTKQHRVSCWTIGVAGGVRYAELDQQYLAQTTNVAGTLSGRIDYDRGISGFGPTLSLYGSVPINRCMELFVRGRGSILFGEAESRFTAGEDLDLTTPFSTSRDTTRDDLLSIGEIQLGVDWRGGRWCNVWQPFASIALEAQHWNGVGNAVSEDGNLGFFGFSTALGVAW